MIKIFTHKKTIYLTDSQEDVPKNGLIKAINSKNSAKVEYRQFISNQQHNSTIYFYHPDFKKLTKYFFSLFKIIEAAGGLVQNTKGEWLFIFRNGKWDLPKGKIEKNESVNEAAIREVEEECGIKKLKIKKELIQTYHTYFIGEKEILKRTYWFEMSSKDNSPLVPQTEEGITDVKWLAASELRPVKDNTYASIIDVLHYIKPA